MSGNKARSCDCWRYAYQVCDIGQGVRGKGTLDLGVEGFVGDPSEEHGEQETGVHTTEVGREDERSLIEQFFEARESYRLANQRIVELLDEKMALEKQCNDLAAALDVATLGGLVNPVQMFEREKTLREALGEIDSIAHIARHEEDCSVSARESPRCDCVVGELHRIIRKALAAAPEAKP